MPNAVTHFITAVILLELFRHFFVKDKNCMPVIDGTEIHLKSNNGKLKPEKIYTKDGRLVYFWK